MESTEVLDRAEISGDKVLVQYKKTELALANLRSKYKGVAYDLTTTKGDKEARAARLELTTLRTSLEKKRKEFKAPALEFGKKIDSEAARITAEIVELEKPIDEQIKADEARRAAEKAERERIEAERVASIKSKIEHIRAFATKCHGISSERIKNGIEQVKLIDVSESVFSEFASDANAAKCDTLDAMAQAYTVATEREAEAARVEAQRIENERIAAEQKRLNDIRDAEFAEQKRLAELQLAEHQRLIDEGNAKLAAQQAELDRQAREIKEAADKIAQEKAEAEAKKQAEIDSVNKARIDEIIETVLNTELPTMAIASEFENIEFVGEEPDGLTDLEAELLNALQLMHSWVLSRLAPVMSGTGQAYESLKIAIDQSQKAISKATMKH